MQNNRNLWLAVLAGTGLTALLMLALYSQVKPLELAEEPTPEPVPTEKIPFQTKLPEPKQSVPESVINNSQNTGSGNTTNPELEPGNQALETANKPDPAGDNTDQQSSEDNANSSNQITDLPGLPEDPTLSQQEIEQLSPQEREKYQVLVKTYQEVRAQVLNLHREREALRQKMDSIIEENTEMDQQLEQLREQHNKTQD